MRSQGLPSGSRLTQRLHGSRSSSSGFRLPFWADFSGLHAARSPAPCGDAQLDSRMIRSRSSGVSPSLSTPRERQVVLEAGPSPLGNAGYIARVLKSRTTRYHAVW